MLPFHILFPEIGTAETRDMTLARPSDEVPAGAYAFVEFYCVDPACDCRRVLFSVLRRDPPGIVATINHALGPSAPASSPEMPPTFLDPLHPQSPFAESLMYLFQKVVLADELYDQRLKRHYAMVKQAIAEPGHPIHGRIPKYVSPDTEAARARRRAAQERHANEKRRGDRAKRRRR